MTQSHTGRARAFTLVEMLAVVIIIGIACSMLFVYNSRRDSKTMQVRSSAEQLASVMRKARAMAMDQKSTFGVAFNICNAPGSSGHVLNNRSGGHWYRIMGPCQHNGQMDWAGTGNGYSAPYITNRDAFGTYGRDFIFHWTTDEWNYDWASPAYTLPTGMVRFLALTDQDNGKVQDYQWSFGPTYPRPWFGWWDRGTGILHPWGGYEPDQLDFDEPATEDSNPAYWAARTGASGTISYTGFYYEGNEGRITGCVNPKDRFLIDDTNGNGYADLADTQSWQLFKAGQPRPLVNAGWLDACILFKPDGSALYQDWFQIRHEFAKYSRARNQPTWYLFNDTFANNLTQLAPVDMCNEINTDQSWEPYNTHFEASSFNDRTGYWYITLAPDADDDRSTFSSAQEALASIMPMWRVGVSAVGEVKVIEVKRQVTAGLALDTAHADSWWATPALGAVGYWNNELWNAQGPAMPVEDFLTAQMLEHRIWWLATPP